MKQIFYLTAALLLLPMCSMAQGKKELVKFVCAKTSFQAAVETSVQNLANQVAQKAALAALAQPAKDAVVKDIPGVGRIYTFKTFPDDFELSGNEAVRRKAFAEYEPLPLKPTEKTYIIQVNSRRGHPHFMPVGMGRLVERLTVFNLRQNSLEKWQQEDKPLRYENLVALIPYISTELSFPVKTTGGEEGFLYTLPIAGLEVELNNETVLLSPKTYVIFYNSAQNTARLVTQTKDELNAFELVGEVPEELQDKAGPQE